MPVFLFLSVFLMSAWAGPEYYLSNPSGQIISRTSGLRWESREWVLEVDEEGSSTLFNFGEEYRRTVTEVSGSFKTVYLFDGEEPVSRAIYMRDTHELKEEILYENSQAWRKSVFYYRDGKMYEKLVFDGQEKLLYKNRYLYGRNGRILKVETRDHTDDFLSSLFWNYDASGIMTDKISMKERQMERSRYDSLYREESRILTRDGDEQTRQEKVFADDGSYSLTEIDLAEQYESRSDYDSEGNLLLRNILYADGEREIYSYTWENGQMQRFVHSRGSLTEEEQWLWQEDQPVQMTYFRNNVKQKVSVYKEGKIDRDEIFRNGQLVVAVEYSNERPVRELYYRNGQLLRKKELIVE